MFASFRTVDFSLVKHLLYDENNHNLQKRNSWKIQRSKKEKRNKTPTVIFFQFFDSDNQDVVRGV